MTPIPAVSDAEPREALWVAVGSPRVLVGGPDRIGDRARRAERRWQDDAATPRDRPRRAQVGRSPRARLVGEGAAARSFSRGSGSWRRSILCTEGSGSARSWTFGRKLNPRWDDELARRRLEQLGLPLERRIGSLSGGQQAQVALTLALAKRPELLVLDEPVAALDPLARREFLQSLMEAVADGGLTVILSSHIVAELERVCDHLVILATGGVRLAGSIEHVLASHRLLTGPRRDPAALARDHTVIQESHTERQTTMLVRLNGRLADAGWRADEVSLEEIVLGYLGQRSALSPEAVPRAQAVAS